MRTTPSAGFCIASVLLSLAPSVDQPIALNKELLSDVPYPMFVEEDRVLFAGDVVMSQRFLAAQSNSSVSLRS